MNDRIINLRTRRKQKARDEKRAEANANAAEFGRTKSERKVTSLEIARDRRGLDGHRLSPDEDSDDK